METEIQKKSSGYFIETLKKKKEVGLTTFNSLVEYLISVELSGEKWRKFTINQLILLIDEKSIERGIPKNDRHLILLKRKLTKCDSIEKGLLILGEGIL